MITTKHLKNGFICVFMFFFALNLLLNPYDFDFTDGLMLWLLLITLLDNLEIKDMIEDLKK